ncbi:hypothetical protein GGF46_002969 [Coemansia sp. RSA 552]|nr:hypothetical protein GGF46_002969 [Coemansia sp. RSA 552]
MPISPRHVIEAGAEPPASVRSAAQDSASATAPRASEASPLLQSFMDDSDDDDEEEEEVMGGGRVSPPGGCSVDSHKSPLATASGTNGSTSADGSLDAPLSHIDASLLIPPSLQGPVAVSAGPSPLDSDISTASDKLPLSTPDDYVASAADIDDFVAGSARRRIRLVLIQLHDLIDRTPRIYELLEQKRRLEGPASAQAHLDRGLNSLWNELKAKCSLLIVDQGAAQNAACLTSLAEQRGCSSHASYLQSLVSSAMEEIARHSPFIWGLLDVSLRGLVFVDCGRKVIETVLAAPDRAAGEVRRDVLDVLLTAYEVLPDLYKAAIKDIVVAIVSSNRSSAQLVVSQLARRGILPGVMFRTLAATMDSNANDGDEALRLMDSIFYTGAASWIGKRGSNSKPRFSSAGDEIRSKLLERFRSLELQQRKQQSVRYTRVLAGLIAYLQLDVHRSDHEFLQISSGLIADTQAAAICTSFMLVLVGFGTQVAAQDILESIALMSGTPAAGHVDCILAQLKTDHVKKTNSFVADTLKMDFVYPRERLFYLKDIVSRTTTPFFLDSGVARRLVRADVVELRQNAEQTELHADAILCALQGSMFQRCGVDVRPWISRLIRTANAATANRVGDLVKAYVAAVFGAATVTPIPETLIRQVFAPVRPGGPPNYHEPPPAQVLCLLYVLHYYARLLKQPPSFESAHLTASKRDSLGPPTANGTQMKSNGYSLPAQPWAASEGPGASADFPGAVKRGEYSDELLDSVPVSWILHCVGQSPEYQHIWPDLLSMATAQFPDQLDVVSVLQCELAGGGDGYKGGAPPSLPHLMRLMRSAVSKIQADPKDLHNASPLLHAMEIYGTVSISERMETCGQFVTLLCQAAAEGIGNREVTAGARRMWFSLHALNPHKVSAATIGAWRSASEQTKPKLTLQDIWLDPLVVLRSDARVLQSANLVEILLTILSEALTLSRTALRRVFALRQSDSGALKMPNLNAMIQLQESGAIQLLVEAAMRVQDSEAQWLIFEFIHARFLEQRTIQKLVHFQTYDTAAIDHMVKYVPSMHACSEFIPELLMQSAPGMQLFAVRLATAIMAKYPISTNESMAKEVVLPHIRSMLVKAIGTAAADELLVCDAMFETVVAISSTGMSKLDSLLKASKSSDTSGGVSGHHPSQPPQHRPSGGAPPSSQKRPHSTLALDRSANQRDSTAPGGSRSPLPSPDAASASTAPESQSNGAAPAYMLLDGGAKKRGRNRSRGTGRLTGFGSKRAKDGGAERQRSKELQ